MKLAILALMHFNVVRTGAEASNAPSARSRRIDLSIEFYYFLNFPSAHGSKHLPVTAKHYINVDIVVSSESRVPDRPENVRVRTTATTATLWWDPPSDKSVLVRGYTVSYGVATPSRRIVIEGPNTNSFTLNRLEPDTEYVFSVSAYNEADGEDGEPVLLSARTLQNDGR
uniref:Fibronectin type-III domain-containing protein n=1 Tax=Angiostrongylus cantonensis TaxID=6313 RepID=A0A0K0CTE9_ANGCA